MSFMANGDAIRMAVQRVQSRFLIEKPVRTGIVLGTGWKNALELEPLVYQADGGIKRPGREDEVTQITADDVELLLEEIDANIDKAQGLSEEERAEKRKEARDALFARLEPITTLELENIAGFTGITHIPGGPRRFLYGAFNGEPVIVLDGRVNMYHSTRHKDVPWMVRLQAEIMLHLGVKNLVLTSACGSLASSIPTGTICIVDGFVTLFGPDAPLRVEHVCPTTPLDMQLNGQAERIARKLETEVNADLDEKHPDRLRVRREVYAIVKGPAIETIDDKQLLLKVSNARVVGMSLVPECLVVAAFNRKRNKDDQARVLPLTFVTTMPDGEDTRDPTGPRRPYDQDRVRAIVEEKGPVLGDYLRRVVEHLHESERPADA